MKIISLKCSECGANLEIADGRTSCYCQYCGSKLILDDEKQEYTINKNININRTTRRIDDAKILHEEYQEKRDELYFTEDTTSYIDLRKLYDENRASVVAELPKLIPVTYTSDEALLRPKTRFGDSIDDLAHKSNGKQSSDIRYDLSNLGKFKREGWRFQKEWRYWISMSPWGMKELEGATTHTHIELARRLEDEKTKPPYERFFVELSDDAISQMRIVFGPRMTEAEKILAKHLIEYSGLGGNWRDSVLRIR